MSLFLTSLKLVYSGSHWTFWDPQNTRCWERSGFVGVFFLISFISLFYLAKHLSFDSLQSQKAFTEVSRTVVHSERTEQNRIISLECIKQYLVLWPAVCSFSKGQIIKRRKMFLKFKCRNHQGCQERSVMNIKYCSEAKAGDPLLDYCVHCNTTLRLTEGPWAPGKPTSPFSPFIPLAPYKIITKQRLWTALLLLAINLEMIIFICK